MILSRFPQMQYLRPVMLAALFALTFVQSLAATHVHADDHAHIDCPECKLLERVEPTAASCAIKIDFAALSLTTHVIQQDRTYTSLSDFSQFPRGPPAH